MREIAFADIKTGDRIRAEFVVTETGWYDHLEVGDSFAIEGPVVQSNDYESNRVVIDFIPSGDTYDETEGDGTDRKFFLLDREKPAEPTGFGAVVKDSNGLYSRVMPSDDGGIYFVDANYMSQDGIVLWDEIGDDVTILFTGVDLD